MQEQICLEGKDCHCTHLVYSGSHINYCCYHYYYHSWQSGCHAEEEKAAAAAEAAASAREATPEVSEEGEIAVDPEELEEISKAQQQAASKQANPQPHHHPAAKQASDRGRDRDRDRAADRDRGHSGQERQAFSLRCSRHCPHLVAACDSCTCSLCT